MNDKHTHTWTPMSLEWTSLFAGVILTDMIMIIGCSCGAWKKVEAKELK